MSEKGALPPNAIGGIGPFIAACSCRPWIPESSTVALKPIAMVFGVSLSVVGTYRDVLPVRPDCDPHTRRMAWRPFRLRAHAGHRVRSLWRRVSCLRQFVQRSPG